MVRGSESVAPVSSLRRQIDALRTAMSALLSGLDRKDVHLLRTSTRRIEAHLALLEFLHVAEPDSAEVRKAHKVLRRVRRAAGRVRDLDVHAYLLETYTAGEEPPSHGTRKGDAAKLLKLRRDVSTLQHTLERRRAKRAEKLQQVLKRKHQGIESSLHELLGTFPASSTTFSPARIREGTTAWFQRQEAGHRIPERTEDDLHNTRKAAKLARYLAEMSPATAELARRFESLQDKGGHWHDLLTLSATAGAELGRKSPLHAALRRDAINARKDYRTALKEFRNGHRPRTVAAAPKKRRRAN